MQELGTQIKAAAKERINGVHVCCYDRTMSLGIAGSLHLKFLSQATH